MVYCCKCGVQNDENNKVCTACGAELVKPEPAASASQNVNTQEKSYYSDPAPSRDVSYENKGEISTLAFIGLFILFMIPVVGLVFAIVWACNGTTNKTLVNFSRASLVVMAIGAVFTIIIAVITFVILGFGITDTIVTHSAEALRELEGINVNLH
ncbi:MAG: zinc ribbon domain-containing protein [Clostridia bacterium]|nr:zinc ribbon domain-containing protein [Clostridia bacterium]